MDLHVTKSIDSWIQHYLFNKIFREKRYSFYVYFIEGLVEAKITYLHEEYVCEEFLRRQFRYSNQSLQGQNRVTEEYKHRNQQKEKK
jgi:hypothetical protein